MNIMEFLKLRMIHICIPTIKKDNNKLAEDIKNTMDDLNYQIVFGDLITCAGKNRNYAMKKSNAKDGDIIILIDDDITGFYKNWCLDLLKPLIENQDNISMVVPRLLNSSGGIGMQLGDGGEAYDESKDIQMCIHTKETQLNISCSACMAFFKNDIYFCEEYRISNYEDSDLCMLFGKQFPNKKIYINNNCKLIHLGESKMKTTETTLFNKQLFAKRWGIPI